MKRYIQYFIKETYGYHEFEAKSREKAEEIMERFFMYSNLDKVLKIKDKGWEMTDLDEEVKKLK